MWSIDWLTVSAKLNIGLVDVVYAYDVANCLLDAIGIKRDSEELQPVKSARFYQYAFVAGQGIRIDLAKDMAHQGAKITISGEGCASQDMHNVLSAVVDNEFNVTRIDIAIDMINPNVEISDMWACLVEREGLKSHRQKQFIDSSNGQTVYIGSRKSDRFIRLYDKGKQQNIVTGDWHRLEAEYKGELVASVVEDILNGGGEVIMDMLAQLPALSRHKSIIQRMIGYDGEGRSLSRSYKERDNYKWWMSSIAPSFEKLCKTDHEQAKKMLDIFTNIMLNSLKERKD